VVAADKVNSIRVSEFQTDKEGNGFDTEKTAVDIVSYTSTSVSTLAESLSPTRRPVSIQSTRGGDY
jgi:hypothetical protein